MKKMFVNEAFRFSRVKTMPNRIVWHINDFCNYGCSYCFFPRFDKEDPVVGRLSPQEIYDAFEKTGRDWHLFISGGEPMLYPNFIELVNLLKRKHPIQISTNLYNKNVKAFAEQVNPENIILINGSLHILHHNDKSLKKFIQNYHMFLEKGFPTAVSYVTYPPLFKRMKSDFEFLKREGVQYVLPLTYNGIYEGKPYPGSYTKEQLHLIKELYQEPLELLVGTQQMRFEGKLCKAGQAYFYMEKNGEVYRCASIRNSYGNLFDGTFTPAAGPTPCGAYTCNDHVHGMMSVLEEPKPPVLEPFTIFEKGYAAVSNTVKSLTGEDSATFKMPSREEQKEFVRTL